MNVFKIEKKTFFIEKYKKNIKYVLNNNAFALLTSFSGLFLYLKVCALLP